MARLLSIDLKADFGMLKKPDTNDPVYLTFNMLHKPALLGILGSIGGISGFKKQGEFPDYLEKYKDIKVGIAPLETSEKRFHDNGNFQKTIIKYNNSTGLASDESGGNLMVTEQTLIAPAYRCYILLDEANSDHKNLYENLLNYQAEFIPYLGKNECSLWWENTRDCGFESFKPNGPFRINSIFIKEETIKESTVITLFELGAPRLTPTSYVYFENLPVGYLGEPLYQYEYKVFAFTNFELKESYKIPDMYPLLKLDNGDVIQVF